MQNSDHVRTQNRHEHYSNWNIQKNLKYNVSKNKHTTNKGKKQPNTLAD